MPETQKKSIFQWFRRSISRKMLFSILSIAVVLGVTAIVIGYTVYSHTMDNHYLNNTIHLADTTAALSDRDLIERCGSRILELYAQTTPEERENQSEEAYRSHFEGIEDDPAYQQARQLLIKIREENDVMFAYIMVIDAGQGVCLYVVDSDTNAETYCPPGAWEPISPEQAASLRHGGEAVITHEEFGWLSSGGSPIYEAEDGTFAAAIIDISMEEVMNDRHTFLRNYCMVLILVIALLSALMTMNMRRQVVAPINRLAKAATEYSYDRAHAAHDAPPMRNHFTALKINTGDELQNLSSVMGEMETQLAEYIDDLTRVTAEKERIGAELSIATQIQADMLPRIFPAFPERDEFDLYASMTPAKEVGGDFYDFFLIDDDHIGLVMADVSGKGVPAALFMVIAKTLIKNQAQICDYSPAKVLMKVNDQLCEGNEAELFVTVWLAIIQISTGKGLAANAGHEHPVIRRAGGQYELSLYRHSPAVATMEGMRFREHPFQLNRGDSLFVYTDGVPEAANPDNEFFGTDRMLEAMNRDPNATPKALLSNVRAAIDAFVGKAPRFDDITMMCFKYLGPSGDDKELTVDATDGNLAKVLAFVDEELKAVDCPAKVQMQIDVAVEELFVNIAHYAYAPGTGAATIRVETQLDPKIATITFIDKGIPYNPLAKPDPDVTLSAEERQIGGLGIYMVKKSMDEVRYAYREDQNILTIIKTLE